MESNYEEIKKYILYGVGIGIGVAVLLILYFLISKSLSVEDAYVDPTGFEIQQEVESWNMPSWAVGMIVLGALFIPVVIFVLAAYGNYWWEARISGVSLGLTQLIKMHLRGVSRKKIVKLLIRAYNSGLEIDADELVNAELAEVDIEHVLSIMIAGKNADVDVEFPDLARHYLSEVNLKQVMEAMKTAVSSGYELNFDFNELANHSLSKVDVQKLVDAYLSAKNGEVNITLANLKEHDLANGDIIKTVDALIAALNAGIPDITFEDIAAIDLSGLNVTKAVHSAIVPKVIETDGVMGHSGDGVQLTMKVKVTVRSFLKRLIGGAGEDTVVARINEGLVTEIGQSARHDDVLRSPYELADRVERNRDMLSQGTAYEILSIDVSNIEVGRDIKSTLRMEHAKTEAEIARTDNIRADEKVKKAMAAAFIDGNLTPREYYNLLNTQADTDMRKSMSDRPYEDPKRNE